MKAISIMLLVFGFFLVAYSMFSRFYGQPSVAFHQFRSLSFLIMGNTLLILSLIGIHFHRYLK